MKKTNKSIHLLEVIQIDIIVLLNIVKRQFHINGCQEK